MLYCSLLSGIHQPHLPPSPLGRIYTSLATHLILHTLLFCSSCARQDCPFDTRHFSFRHVSVASWEIYTLHTSPFHLPFRIRPFTPLHQYYLYAFDFQPSSLAIHILAISPYAFLRHKQNPYTLRILFARLDGVLRRPCSIRTR